MEEWRRVAHTRPGSEFSLERDKGSTTETENFPGTFSTLVDVYIGTGTLSSKLVSDDMFCLKYKIANLPCRSRW